MRMRTLRPLATGLLAAALLAGCSGQSASEQLQNMTDDEWEAMPEDEQLELIQDVAAEQSEVDGEEPAAGEPAEPEPVEPGGSYTYDDGLVITLSEPYETNDPSVVPSRYYSIDIIASNPTDQVINTSQAWLSLRAGDTGEAATEYALESSLDAVLQPGAEASAGYHYDLPMDVEHVTATVQWLESDTREDAVFIVTP